MKRKIFILIVLTFILCGCEATYNLNITDQNIDELTEIHNYNKETWESESPSYKELINNNYQINLPTNYNIPGFMEDFTKQEGYNYYNKELITNNNDYGLKIKYQFNNEDYIYSSMAKSNVQTFKFINNNDTYAVSATDFSYPFNAYSNLDKITINVNTNYIMTNANYDSSNKNTYTWTITRDNCQKKTIHFSINTSKNNKKVVGNKTFNIIIIAIGIILIMAFIIITIKVKKSNK